MKPYSLILFYIACLHYLFKAYSSPAMTPEDANKMIISVWVLAGVVTLFETVVAFWKYLEYKLLGDEKGNGNP